MELPSLDEFSLWLEPVGHEYEKLSKFMSHVQKLTQCPEFIPHVTLLANIPHTQAEIESLMGKLTTGKSLEISFENAKLDDLPYKSLFLECKPSDELTSLNKITQKIYGVDKPYHPHMSLAYGIIEDNLKKKLLEEIEKKSIDFFSFDAAKISLWHALGNVRGWKKLKEINLS